MATEKLHERVNRLVGVAAALGSACYRSDWSENQAYTTIIGTGFANLSDSEREAFNELSPTVFQVNFYRGWSRAAEQAGAVSHD